MSFKLLKMDFISSIYCDIRLVTPCVKITCPGRKGLRNGWSAKRFYVV
jgi:hypothetical protein